MTTRKILFFLMIGLASLPLNAKTVCDQYGAYDLTGGLLGLDYGLIIDGNDDTGNPVAPIIKSGFPWDFPVNITDKNIAVDHIHLAMKFTNLFLKGTKHANYHYQIQGKVSKGNWATVVDDTIHVDQKFKTGQKIIVSREYYLNPVSTYSDWRVHFTDGTSTELLFLSELSEITFYGCLQSHEVFPTSTFTNTPTATWTRTKTSTPTATKTYTRTSTPTFTYSSTNTFTRTATNTTTNTSTRTSTNTPTPTMTNTATNTSTNSSTNTHTATSTSTNTASNTPTSTNSATNTSTFTLTSTSTNTATVTYTYSMTSTSTATATSSFTATGTSTPTKTNTMTFTSTNTSTSTAAKTNTPSATPSGSYFVSTSVSPACAAPGSSINVTFVYQDIGTYNTLHYAIAFSTDSAPGSNDNWVVGGNGAGNCPQNGVQISTGINGRVTTSNTVTVPAGFTSGYIVIIGQTNVGTLGCTINTSGTLNAVASIPFGNCAAATATYTPTNTPIPTNTATRTQTATSTSSYSPTPTATVTETGTPTSSPTATLTFTITPTYTATTDPCHPTFACQYGAPQTIAPDGFGDAQIHEPYGVVAAPDGTIYVSERGQTRVEIYNADGSYHGHLGDGQLMAPGGLAYVSGILYVADNHRVAKFDSTGAYLGNLVDLGTGYPWAIQFDSTDSFYVVDIAGQNVKKFNPAGTALWTTSAVTFGSSTYAPQSLALSEAKGILFVGSGADKIFGLDPATGNSIWVYGGPGNCINQQFGFISVALDQAGNLIVGEANGHRVKRFQAASLGIGLNPVVDADIYNEGSSNYIANIATDPQSNVLVIEGGNGTNDLLRFSNCSGVPAPLALRKSLVTSAAVQSVSTQGQTSPTFTPTLTPSTTPTSTATPGYFIQSVVAAPNLSRNGTPIHMKYNLTRSASVRLSILSTTGEQVLEMSLPGNAGDNTWGWNLTNKTQRPVASGLYVYYLEVTDGIKVERRKGNLAILH